MPEFKTVALIGAFDRIEGAALDGVAQAAALGDRLVLAVWSDEICFLRNGRMPERTLADRVAAAAALPAVAAAEALHLPALTPEHLASLGADGLALGAEDAAEAAALPADQVRTLPALAEASLAAAGAHVQRSPAQEEFDAWYLGLMQKPSVIDMYHQFIAVFLDLLDRAGIEYFAHSGTSLGMIRNAGFIPWDDDFDVMVDEKFEDKVLEMVPVFERYGIFRNLKNDNKHMYQFYFRHPKVALSKHTYIPIDIFIGHLEEHEGAQVMHYKSPTFRKWFAKNFINVEDIQPLRHYAFGPLQIKGIRDYTRYQLRSRYSLVEAVVMRHQNFEAHKAKLEHFKALGLHPITDLRYVTFRVPAESRLKPTEDFAL
jgi:hypothetical protein